MPYYVLYLGNIPNADLSLVDFGEAFPIQWPVAE
jgi:hypothetical protein